MDSLIQQQSMFVELYTFQLTQHEQTKAQLQGNKKKTEINNRFI
jgi:hypothetical protein